MTQFSAGSSGGTEFVRFTASTTWDKPDSIDWVLADVISGGGGGSPKGNTNYPGGGGGGGGGRAKVRIPASELPDSVSVTVGAGGTESSDGGYSEFGPIRVDGGKGGEDDRGGDGGGVDSATSGAGEVAPGFSASVPQNGARIGHYGGGSAGSSGSSGNPSYFGAGGGGGGDEYGNPTGGGSTGAYSGNANNYGEDGASGSLLFCGEGGGGGAQDDADGTEIDAGDGGIPGGGGGGGGNDPDANGETAPGVGARGEVRVWYW